MGENTIGEFLASKNANNRLGIRCEQELWEWVCAGGVENLVNSPWALTPGTDTFFRGQADSTYGLTSHLYRLCRTTDELADPVPVTEKGMTETEEAIIEGMKAEGIGRQMSDGELLAVLQHHGIPTRLIDVSAAMKEALFFAVDQQHGTNGRLFIIHLHPKDDGKVDTVNFRAEEELPWANAAYGTERARKEWSDRVALVDQDPLDPRMRAQRGKFLVGGLNRTYGGRAYENAPKDKRTDVSTLGINLLKSKMGKPSSAWRASGWTVLVEAGWKQPLLERLAAEPERITPDHMYPPLGEVRRLALRLAREKVKPPASP